MIIDNTNNFNSLIRSVEAKVELYSGSTIANTFTKNDALKSLKVERVGEDGKFFGFGYCQKIEVKLLDKNRALNIETGKALKVSIKAEGDFISPFPIFIIAEVGRDENTNEITLTGYDALEAASCHNMDELSYTLSDTIQGFAQRLATHLGLNKVNTILPEDDTVFSSLYDNGFNFGGSETIREALNAIAEAT